MVVVYVVVVAVFNVSVDVHVVVSLFVLPGADGFLNCPSRRCSRRHRRCCHSSDVIIDVNLRASFPNGNFICR